MSDNNIQPDSDINPDITNPVHGYNPYPLLHPVAAGFIGLIGGFFLYVIGGSLLTLSLLIFGYNLESPPVNAVRIITIIGQVLFLLIPALLFAKWIFGNVSGLISFKMPGFTGIILFVFGSLVLIPLLQIFLFIQNSFIEWLAANSSFIGNVKNFVDSIDELVEKTYLNLITADNGFEMFLVFITIAVVPAFCEEALFRGYVQSSFAKKLHGAGAAALTAFFFASYHLNPYGFIPLFILGFYFGFAAYKTGSLVIPVILHFLNNFSAVLLYYIIGDEDIISSAPSGNGIVMSDLLYFFLLLLIFLVTIYFINKYYSKLKTA